MSRSIAWAAAACVAALLGCDPAQSDPPPASDDDTPEHDDDVTDDDATDDDSQPDDDIATEDADGDGWQSPEDCDDQDVSVNPGASEVCLDGIDNNCDGAGSPCRVEGLFGAGDVEVRLRGEREGAEAGFSIAKAGDYDGDGQPDLVVGSPGGGGANAPGTAYILASPLAIGDGPLGADVALASATGAANGDRFGAAVAAGGDIDGDGFDDVLVGAPEARNGTARPGAAYLFRGPRSGVLGAAEADATLMGVADGELAGSTVAAAGDVNGDGYEDLLVGAENRAVPSTASGGVYVVFGPVEGTLSLSDADVIFQPASAAEAVGASLLGDVDLNGDGIDDIVIGAPGAQGDAPRAGRVYIVHGPIAPGVFDLASAPAILTGELGNDFAGQSIACAGDQDGDGVADLIVGAVGAPEGASTGAIFVAHGPFDGSRSLEDAAVVLYGEGTSHNAGNAVAGSGDFDGDGWNDVVIGAPGFRTDGLSSQIGAAYLLYGPIEVGVRYLTEAHARFDTGMVDSYTGWSVAWSGDVDGDGRDDLAVGAPFEAEVGGAVYVKLGNAM